MLMISLGGYLLFALAQAARTAPPAMATEVSTPQDPRERMALARKVNGLQGPDIQPWHLKASYEAFDNMGKSKTKGTFEEWRINPTQYKLVYSSPEFSQTEFATEHGKFRVGAQDGPGRPVERLRASIEDPIPPQAAFDETGLTNFERKIGKDKLPCTSKSREGVNALAQDADYYCFAPTNAVLLYSSGPGQVRQMVFEHISSFRGHYLGRDIQIFLAGMLSLSFHLETLESVGSSALPDLSVPANAFAVPAVAGAVVAPRLIKDVAPITPAEAIRNGVMGTVVVEATIGKDGHPKNMEVLAGPLMLQQAAIATLKQWVFTPCTRNGEPVEVQIEISVKFR